MVGRLSHYLSQPLVFIHPEQSKHFEKYKPIEYPVAKCDDIDIFFMHYHSENEAEEKWRRRAARVDLNNAYVLLFENESTTLELVEQFDKIPFAHKALIFSDYHGIRNFVRNAAVLADDNHHWSPNIVIQSCDWKSEFNNMKRTRK